MILGLIILLLTLLLNLMINHRYNDRILQENLDLLEQLELSNTTIQDLKIQTEQLERKLRSINNSYAYSEWEINPDGYYPYCPSCFYEPSYQLIQSVNGLHNLHRCPKCDLQLRFDEVKPNGTTNIQ